MDAKTLPATLMTIFVVVLLVVSLVPELRTEIAGATNITGASATILGYLGVAIVGGLTILIVAKFMGGGKSTRMIRLENFVLKTFRGLVNALPLFLVNAQGVTSIQGALVTVVVLVIVFIIAVNFLDVIADAIANATGTGGTLENTLEGTLLDNWVLILVSSMVIGAIGLFGVSAYGRKRRR